MCRQRRVTTQALLATLLAGSLALPAAAQSDPAGFDTVYNIGDVPPGSIFDITSDDIPGEVANGTVVGNPVFLRTIILTPAQRTGNTLGSNSQLNLFNGGEIRGGFSASPMEGAGSNIELNISGGNVGNRFAANSGSTVNMSGGNVGAFFGANAGSTLNIAGGTFELNSAPLNDLSTGFGIGLPNTGVFTGILADGSVFIFAGETFDVFDPGTTTLQPVAVPPSANPGVLSSDRFTQGVRAGETLVVNGAGELGDHFAVVGGTLNIQEGLVGDGLEVANGEVNITGGTVGDFFNAFSGSTVNISGGTVGDNIHAYSGSTVHITEGSVGRSFDASPGSTVNISGGNVGDFFAAAGSTVNINGGTVGEKFRALSGSTVNINGGTMGRDFNAGFGSTININGGSVDNSFRTSSNSNINISGGSLGRRFIAKFAGVKISGDSFEFNGVAVNSLPADFGLGFSNTDLLTGILSDGSVFIFAGETEDEFDASMTTLLSVAVPPSANPGVLSSGLFTRGVRPGETLTINGAGELGDHFAIVGGTLNIQEGLVGDGVEVAHGVVNVSGGTVGSSFAAFSGSTVNINGGTTGEGFTAYSSSTVNINSGNVGEDFTASAGSTVNISGGIVGDGFRATSGSTVDINGGNVGEDFTASAGSTVNISGGIVGDGFRASSGSTVNINGGNVGDLLNAFSGSTVNISGGTVNDGFRAFSGSSINLFGIEFFLDGVELTVLTPGVPFTVINRDVTLSGTLADGSVFEFALNSRISSGADFFSPGDLLNLTLVSPTVPADLDMDGDVDDADFGLLFAAFSGPGVHTINPAADLDGDSDVDDADFGIVFAAFTGPGGPVSVPEPASLAMLALGGATLVRRRRV